MSPQSRRDPDRLLPADPYTREVARELYFAVRDAPIISPHGHVPVQWLSENTPFQDPADLLVKHDHYITRLLHASGVGYEMLGMGSKQVDPRTVWRILAQHWAAFAGTASGYWLEEELSGVLGIEVELGPDTADATYAAISERLRQPSFLPRALFEQFRISVLATTDDPLDDLVHHDRLRGVLPGRVVPTFRPDKYIDPDATDFHPSINRLLALHGETATFAGYLDCLRARRAHFVEHGAVSADHGVETPIAVDLDASSAETLFQKLLARTASATERAAFRGHMLLQMARMSVEDGLVMTVHAGVLRNHHTPTAARFGPDTGHDIPVSTDFVRGLRPLLEKFGTAPEFHLVLFAVDESVYSREIGPLAGFYPSVFIGAPWWFLDAPDAIARFRSATTETAGFSRGSGFVDDTRAFLSIPARHDTARRADAGFLARLVVEGRVTTKRAAEILQDSVVTQPTRVFKL